MIVTATCKLLRVGGLFLLPLLLGVAAYGQDVTGFEAVSPVGLTLGPDGAVWFADQGLSAIRRISTTGSVAEFLLADPPQSITAGPDGNLWYTLISPARIGRLTPAGEVRKFPLPAPSATSFSIATGRDGGLWFTQANLQRIGRITTSGDITEFAAPLGFWIGQIAAGPDGNLWFTIPDAFRICRITPSGAVTQFVLPTAGSKPIDVTAGPDGNLWFVASLATYDRRVGRISPDGEIVDFPVPGYADRIIAGGDGNLWLAGYSTLQRMTTSGALTEYDGTAIYSNVLGLAQAPEGSIWVAVGTDGWGAAGKVLRFRLDLSPCAVDDTTLCLGGGRFRVTADWNGHGASGRGHAVNLSDKGGYFWFFDPSNLELVVKIVNGCPANKHHWAFAAGLTSVHVSMTVTDTSTGVIRTYSSSPGEPFPAVLDTAAFSNCP